MNPFATLGLEPAVSIDAKEIERRYRDLQRALHPDRHAQKPASERRMHLEKAVEVNEAYRVLTDDVRRAEAVFALRGVAVDEKDGRIDPAFLMEVMELREGVSEAAAKGDAAALVRFVADAETRRAALLAELEQAAGANGANGAAVDEARATELLGRLRYVRRLLDELEAMTADLEEA
ncbi:MAG: Fe-S protein assembly co-chaperone HscB [Polyangiales bacterium]|nr:Fe-S protein assembly co-chaperone HscB [Myxococcales bacterium]